MEYTPSVPITPRVHKIIIIQKERFLARGKNADSVGGSPKKSFTRKNLKKEKLLPRTVCVEFFPFLFIFLI